MKLSIGSLVLADTTLPGVSVYGMMPQIERLVDVVAYINAASVSTFHRGNRKTTFRFSISREHANEEQALLFFFTHEQAIEPNTALIIKPTNSVGNITIAGNLQAVSSPIVGVRTTFNYTFIGGTPVATGFELETESGETLTTEDGTPLSI